MAAAPEIAEGRPYACPADVWAVGVALYTSLAGRRPFEARTSALVLRKVREDAVPYEGAPWDAVSPDARDLLSSLLQRQASERPTADAVLTHPWFHGQAKALVPGNYTLQQNTSVRPTMEQEEIERILEVGSIVEVVEVSRVDADHRIRGRLAEGGWINLMDTEDGYMFAVRERIKQLLDPSKCGICNCWTRANEPSGLKALPDVEHKPFVRQDLLEGA
jgi:serine/threonine protein kinase